MKKFLRGLVFVIACLVTLVALFYAVENWRGRHAWEKYRAEREAKGDRFDWAAITPPPVPDDMNFAAIPLFAELFPKPSWQDSRLNKALQGWPNCQWSASNWREGRVEDFAVWRACFSNENLSASLARYEPILHEVSEALHERPKCRFPIQYEKHMFALLPHLNVIRRPAFIYRLRALIALTEGRTEAAAMDVQTCLRLAGCLKDEPLLISFLVRVALFEYAIQPIWEGVATHRWTDAQLSALQGELAKVDMLANVVRALQGERLLMHSAIQSLRDNPRQFAGMNGDDVPEDVANLARFVPAGWFYQNQLRIDRIYAEELPPTIDVAHRRVDAKATEAVKLSLGQMKKTPYTVLSLVFTPPINLPMRKAAMSQTAVDSVVTTCALERYRLAHGEFPERLDALVPQFLAVVPHDVVDGQPLRYKRSAADRFRLYSIGWNGIDDGGVIEWTPSTPRRLDDSKGDWVLAIGEEIVAR